MFEQKNAYTLDFTNAKDLFNMHEIIADELDFPDYYGANWSALWDCLTDMLYEPIHIEIIGMETVKRFNDGTDEKLLSIMKKLKHYSNDRFIDRVHIDIILGDNIISLT